MDYHRQHGVRVKIIRIFNTYGPRMAVDDGRVVSNFIVQALRGEPLTIYGDGSQTRSFMYIDDLLDGMERMMATDDGVIGPVNIGNPEETSILELSKEIMGLGKSESKFVHLEIPADDPKVRRPSLSKAQRMLNGWKLSTDLHRGLAKTMGYFISKA